MPSQDNDSSHLLISYMTLRKAIGFLGILIPAVMIAGTFTIGGCTRIQNSISHYYFTVMGDVFVGFLMSTGIFLISYKGYDLKDNIVSSIAGIAVICIALFPTTNNKDVACVIRTVTENSVITNVHYIGAAIFYLTLSYMSIFLFTKSSGSMTREKRARNRIYRGCGVTIIISILLIFFQDYIPGMDTPGLNPTFWLEWVANFAYGLSWLTKGAFLLTDKAPSNPVQA